MQKSVMHGGKRYNPNKMTVEQKGKLKESDPKLYDFMFGERKQSLNKQNKNEKITNQ